MPQKNVQSIPIQTPNQFPVLGPAYPTKLKAAELHVGIDDQDQLAATFAAGVERSDGSVTTYNGPLEPVIPPALMEEIKGVIEQLFFLMEQQMIPAKGSDNADLV